jgi:hypothetical protein
VKLECGESVASVGRYFLLTTYFLQSQSLAKHDLDKHSIIQESKPHGKQVIAEI